MTSPPSISYRIARVTDLPRIITMVPKIGANAAHAAHFEHLLGQNRCWVAETDHVSDSQDTAPGAALLVGVAIVSHYFYGRPFLEFVWVDASYRRGGIAYALVHQCEQHHTDDRIFTSTNTSNAPMRALLHKMGWIESGVIDNLDPGDPELVFVKLRAPSVVATTQT